jgi:hypothetical protein
MAKKKVRVIWTKEALDDLIELSRFRITDFFRDVWRDIISFIERGKNGYSRRDTGTLAHILLR